MSDITAGSANSNSLKAGNDSASLNIGIGEETTTSTASKKP